MNIVCLDLEGVTAPEMWIEFADAAGIPELRKTTRDEPDYDKLMQYRLKILKEHGLGLNEIQATIAKVDLLPGAREFMDELRSFAQVIILSDTFEEFAKPLIKKLGNPTIFCHTLEVAPDGEITGYKLRTDDQKYKAVKALHSLNFDTIAAGDSYNDLRMIQNSKAGAFFRTTDKIKAEHPEIPALETYQELLDFIRANM
jgi:phosphoserine / homoserine phosphotransferase